MTYVVPGTMKGFIGPVTSIVFGECECIKQ